MSFQSRLRRIEKAVEEIHKQPARCASCGAPSPSFPTAAFLVDWGIETRPFPRRTPDEVVTFGGMDLNWIERTPCSDCGALDGANAIPADPRTGQPAYSPGVILLGMTWNEWHAKHGEKDWGRTWTPLLEWYGAGCSS